MFCIPKWNTFFILLLLSPGETRKTSDPTFCWDLVAFVGTAFPLSIQHFSPVSPLAAKVDVGWVGLCFHLVWKVGPCWSVFLNQIKNIVQQIWLMFHNKMLSSSVATFLTIYPWRNDVPNKQTHENLMHDLKRVFVSSLGQVGGNFIEILARLSWTLCPRVHIYKLI